MSNNSMFTYSFSSAGKNKYFASEVDDFISSISESYDALSKNFKALEKKMKTIGPAIEEYNAKKNTICSAIVRVEAYVESVKAQSEESSAEIIRQASEEAENLLLTKKAEAEAYYYNVTHDADEKLEKLNRDIETLERQSLALQEKYLSETKEKAAEIIDNAKTKAAEIVAAAYYDAKAAREQSDSIIASTTAELTRLKAEIAKYKNEIFSVVATIKPAVDSISDDAEFDFEPTVIDVDTDKLAEALPEFELDINYDEAQRPANAPSFYEDISSVTAPSEEAEKQQEGFSLDFNSFNADNTDDMPSDIFSDSGDDTPLDFSYQPDYDDFFDLTDK